MAAKRRVSEGGGGGAQSNTGQRGGIVDMG